MNSTYDVIIVGSGIAGLNVAKGLNGLKVLLIDMKKEPYRGIACAEWTPKIPEFAQYAVSSVGQMEIYYGGKKRILKSPGFVIDREKYQEDLLQKLKAEVHLGERVLEVSGNRVSTTYGTYKGDIIVGADGPLSVFSDRRGGRYLVAINTRVPLKKELKSTIVFFDRRFKYGYAWCFPRGDVANCGIGAETRRARELLYLWIDMLNKKGFIKGNKLYDTRAGLIPLEPLPSSKESIHILVGDAGGFIDPLTGAGIAFALESASIARDIIIKGKAPEEYRKVVFLSHMARFLKRSEIKRKIMEEKWDNIEKAVEESWLSSFRV